MADRLEAETGSPFPGVIGRTVDESIPAWPAPRRARPGAPNVVFIVLDDVGFAQLSCYGSPIETPVMDRLAAGGFQFNNMHATPQCSPTRSCVLTGRNHHANGMGTVNEMGLGFPGYNGRIPFSNGMVSETLRDNGYNTYAVGKWHLAPTDEMTAAGPYDRWPLGRGFERFYGFMAAATDQYHPVLTYDNHEVHAPRGADEGYHLTEDLVDRAIGFVADGIQAAPDKPFFLYFCTGSGHSPHQVPRSWADHYSGGFDDGWDGYRATVFARQQEIGVIPADTVLSPRNPDVPDWEALSTDEKRICARFMEVFAGFISHTDHHIGRLLEFLQKIDRYDNTLIMLVSDNGASAEGGPLGVLSNDHHTNRIEPTTAERLAALDEIHGPKWRPNYPQGWAWAGNTPFRRWKLETYRGGVSEPFIVSWPDRIVPTDEVLGQYLHVIDMAPTVLDALGIDAPTTIRGVDQTPLHGISFARLFAEPDGPETHVTQYFEMLGHRAIYHDGWRAVCPWTARDAEAQGITFTAETLTELDLSGWELYQVTEDFAESVDVSASHPAKLIEMITRWYIEAGRYGVLPLDGRFRDRIIGPRMAETRRSITLYPGTQTVPARPTIVKVVNRHHRIVADVDIPPGGAEGVLFNLGGNTGGFTLFVQEGRLRYTYNNLGRVFYRLRSTVPVPEGHHELRFEFRLTGEADVAGGRGAPGRGLLSIDGDPVGEIDMADTTPLAISLSYGATCGSAGPGRVTDEFRGRYPFTGTIHSVTLAASGEPPDDIDTEIQAILKEQ